MIIGLSGWAQSGKDTVAARLVDEHGFERVAFADKLKEYALKLNPILETGFGPELYDIDESRLSDFFPDGELGTLAGWNEAKKVDSVREFLQTLGESTRQIFGEHIWIDAVKEEILSARDVVVTDVRYWSEYAWLASQGARMCRVHRDGVTPANDHVSEHEWTRLHYPAGILNNGTIEELHAAVDELLRHFSQMRRFAEFDDVP